MEDPRLCNSTGPTHSAAQRWSHVEPDRTPQRSGAWGPELRTARAAAAHRTAMRLPSTAQSSLMRRYSSSRRHLRARKASASARLATKSTRLRHRVSSVYAVATFAASLRARVPRIVSGALLCDCLCDCLWRRSPRANEPAANLKDAFDDD